MFSNNCASLNIMFSPHKFFHLSNNSSSLTCSYVQTKIHFKCWKTYLWNVFQFGNTPHLLESSHANNSEKFDWIRRIKKFCVQGLHINYYLNYEGNRGWPYGILIISYSIMLLYSTHCRKCTYAAMKM